MEQIMSDQMNGVYFPVTVREFGAHVTYEDLDPRDYNIEGVKITTFELSHPGGCLGYKIQHQGKTIVYMTDNELFPKDSDYYVSEVRDEFIQVIQDADILMHDTTYTDNEYTNKVQWGHSCVSEVARLAHDAKIKNLYLIHHDPDQNDDAIDAKFEACCQILKELGSNTKCITPKEGDSVNLSQL
jgi:phosphoribosyl 1,2-cyclic phosphodiesterase